MRVYKVLYGLLVLEGGGTNPVPSGDYVQLEDYQKVEKEREALLNVVQNYYELPFFCWPCIEEGKGEFRFEWDGVKLRCPTCKSDALEEHG